MLFQQLRSSKYILAIEALKVVESDSQYFKEPRQVYEVVWKPNSKTMILEHVVTQIVAVT
jgi:hypothetical protein